MYMISGTKFLVMLKFLYNLKVSTVVMSIIFKTFKNLKHFDIRTKYCIPSRYNFISDGY
jgi:hypothetical protein